MGKHEPDLDWTIDDSPDDRQADHKPVRLGLRVVQRAMRVAPRRPSFFRRHRRRLLLLGGAVLAIAIGVYAVYSLGWQRVRASLTDQIVYEDARSIAGDVDAVVAVQAAGDDAWLGWRAAQVRLGQASLPPAQTFTALPRAPRLLRLDVRENGRFDAVVLRDFADPAGQSVTFEYHQRYHQLAPGVWESLPPDTASLADTRHWAGLHISATYPLADERWMLAVLPKIDGSLQAACVDWGCPPGSVLPLVFLGQLPVLPRPGAPPAGQTYPAALRLLSLQLAGYPHDDNASQALSRALTAQLLEQLAVDLAGTNRYVRNPYLDALVDRAQIRLKLAPELAEPLRPSDLAAPGLLWPQPSGAQLVENNQGPRPRQQALRFLNDLLPHFPSNAEAALLADAGHASSLANWLADSLSIDGQAAIDDWSKNAASKLAATFPAHWDELSGLAYACPSGAKLVRGGQPELLGIPPAGAWLPRAAVSPDGRWLATARISGANVTLMDLSTTPTRTGQLPAGAGRHIWPLGWTPDGQLALANNPGGQFVFGVNYQFDLLDPATTGITHLGNLLLAPENWLRGQPILNGKLAVTVVRETQVPVRASPAVVTLASPLELHLPFDLTAAEGTAAEQASPEQGFSQSLSPDGRWLAYQPSEEAPPGRPWPPAHVTLFDTLTQQSLQVLISESVADGALLHDATTLTWLPDGSGLVFIVRTNDARTRLMRLTIDPNQPAAGADASEIPTPISIAYLAGISSDNRYLAAAVPADVPVELLVLDLATNEVVAHAALAPDAQLGGVWSPTGHQLAVQGPAGLYVIDPATNEQQWIADGACQPAWYDLRAPDR